MTNKIDIVWRWAGLASNDKKLKAIELGFDSHVFPGYTIDLKYSMRSICRYAPWFYHAFLVVDDDEVLPPWLDLACSRITVVKHSEIIPKAFLPTYNSNVIDSYLHKIPGLSEFFLVLDDEMFICKKVLPSTFFDVSSSKPINRHYEGKDRHSLRPHKFMFVKMWQNAIRNYTRIKYTRVQHHIQPFRKSIMQSYQDSVFAVDLQCTGTNRTRAMNDINLLRFTTALSSSTGDAIMMKTSSKEEMFFEAGQVDESISMLVVDKRPTFLCINNTTSQHVHVYKLLARLFPRRCEFEVKSPKQE